MTRAPTETRVVVATDDDMMSVTELLLMSAEHRFGRMANALEKAANAATAGANNIETLTAQVHRLADAFEAMAGVIGCITQSVEGADGVSRCFVRTREDNHAWLLAERDERDTDED